MVRKISSNAVIAFHIMAKWQFGQFKPFSCGGFVVEQPHVESMSGNTFDLSRVVTLCYWSGLIGTEELFGI